MNDENFSLNTNETPSGVCPDCCRAMQSPNGPGVDAVRIELDGGMYAVGIWCPHRRAGAHAILGQQRPACWTTSQPISLETFLTTLNSLPENFRMAKAIINEQIDEALKRAH